jgi:Holliday junction DNA helicase RuvA
MIEFVEGILVESHPTHAVIMSGGVAFRLNISVSSFSELGTPGNHVRLLTHLHFRDSDLELYGFFTELERAIFRQLISVTGIGPKSAVGILSAVQPAELHRAVVMQDVDRLIAVPGIGRKTAQRLMVELKDKLEAIIPAAEATGIPSEGSLFMEAVDALIALGYPKHHAEKAVKSSLNDRTDIPLEDVIRQALQII